jgi:hypothetical protein
VANAVEATAEALDHYRSMQSFAGFDEGVQRGISYEMTHALMLMTSNSDGADVSIKWDPAAPVGPLQDDVSFEFKASDAAILSTASARLLSDTGPQPATLVGRVHLLTKKHLGGPGVFGIETFDIEDSNRARKVRVRLSDEGYHEAVRAHDEDRAVRVSGTLEREGNMIWLYQARIDAVLNPIGDDAALWEVSESRGQGALFPGSDGEEEREVDPDPWSDPPF